MRNEEPTRAHGQPIASPADALAVGRGILDPILIPHGFAWVAGAAGQSSGGLFASGEFVRGNRYLEIHFRHSLGLVTYHVGNTALDHASYMRAVLGVTGGNRYPGFSSDPIDGFRHLAHDLQNFCQSFVSGSDEQFNVIASDARANGYKAIP
jgi:hypothetical protein